MSEGLNRRDFLKVVGVTGVAASAAACGVEQEVKLVPYVVPPEEIVPGVPLFYASTCRECPAGCGIHVKTREGRPIKIEGNPAHPVNRGTTCARGQASLQGLYNPDRVTGPMQKTGTGFQGVAWDAALKTLSDKVAALKNAGNGQAVWLVTPALTGSLDALCGEWLAAAGSTNRVVYEPFGLEAVREGSRLAFGRDEVPQYAISRAKFIVSFGAEFLDAWNSPLEHTREFTTAHAFGDGRMARFVAVDPRLSLVASNADEWIAPAPGTEMLLALAMAQAITASGKARNAVTGLDLSAWSPEKVAGPTGVPAETITRLAAEFADARPSLALPGGVALQHANAAAFAVAVNILNYVAGNIGATVVFGAQPLAEAPGPRGAKGMADLIAAMNGGKVQVLVILDANPAYSLPKAFGSTEALARVPFKVSIAQFLDETAEGCDLVLADHAPLESWGDWAPRPGVASLQQPTIQPLYDTRQAMDILIQTARGLGAQPGGVDAPAATAMDYVMGRWRQAHAQALGAEPFEVWWRSTLAKGGIFSEVAGFGAVLGDVSGVRFEPPALAGEGLAFVAYPGVAYDGRGANRPWLLEMPDPITKTVWSTPVEIHPETAEKNGIEMADVVEITTPAGTIEAIAFVTPGIRKDAIAVPFGWGHRVLGRWAKGLGSNACDALPAVFDAASGAPAWLSVKARVSSKGPAPFDLRTQISTDQEGRGIAQSVSLAALMGHGGGHEEHAHEPPPGTVIPVEQWPETDARSPDYRWGMAIDLSRCTGCSACTVACYAENNIPMIGASGGVLNGLKNFEQGRIMTWIRLERYVEEDAKGNVIAEQLPMLCQQCGAAPCEPVCPVFAAYHDDEGLNAQVYNRCVGTRYCSNNCPYKVRRFNWFEYVWAEPLHLQLNPDVTVRCKGVMEKCTFCVQRIQVARDHAKDAERTIRDGEVTPACAQACPTQAITFGNLKDPNSRVSALHRDPRTYRVLEQLNVRPAVAYLKRVRAEHGEA